MDTQLLSAEEINSRLEELPEWEYDEEQKVLSTDIELEGFHEAADFIHQIAEVTEDLDHHPDILLHDYKFVTIFTSTHDANGITEKDFELIAAIEDLFDEAEQEGEEMDEDDEDLDSDVDDEDDQE